MKNKVKFTSTSLLLDNAHPDFLNLAESSPNMIFINYRGRVVYANGLCETIMGYSKKELYSSTFDFRRLIAPESLPKIEEMFAGHLKGMEQPSVEYRLVTKDRRYLDAVISTRLINYNGDKAILGIVNDVSQYKDIQRTLDFRLKLERLVAGIATRFVNLKFGDIDAGINDALRELGAFLDEDRSYVFRFSDDCTVMDNTHEWVGLGVSSFINDLQRLKMSDYSWSMSQIRDRKVVKIKKVSDLPAAAAVEKKDFTSQGIQSLILVPLVCGASAIGFLGFDSVRREKDWDDDVVGLLTIVGEILAFATEKRKVADELAKERLFIAALMDNMIDYIYFKDRESRFIRINQALSKLMKLKDPSEAIGRTDRDFFPPEVARRFLSDEQRVMATNKPIIGVEEKTIKEDGSVIWASTTKAPLHDEEGNIIGTFGISRDIAEKKRQEEENNKIQAKMQHAQKLESLGVLSGCIAHDFNNLLMGILGNAGLAQVSLGPEFPAWANIKQIETIAQRATELTNQLLAYSGKTKSNLQPLDMTQLVREMGHLLEVSINKRARLIYELVDNLPLVECDPGQIRQVVMNLITNASDAVEGRAGEITLRTAVVDVDRAYLLMCNVGDDLKQGRYVCVEIIDNGCGMDAGTQARIFDPFFTTKVTGRGLGLAAVLGIVRAHKGALKFASETGKGTHFKILLPCSGKKVQGGVVQEQKTTWRGNGVALVIDDDEFVLEVACKIMSRIGFDVIRASTARDGLEQFAGGKKFVVVVLDVTLPETTVDQVLSELHRIDKDVPVLLMSGYSEESVAGNLPEDTYQGFIQKPFRPDVLTAKLQEILK